MQLDSVLFVFATLVAVSLAAEKCYYCEETDKICVDPVDVANLRSATCDPDDFVSPRNDDTRTIEGQPEEKPKNLKGSVDKIYDQDVSSRALVNVTFECIKVSVTSKNVTGTYRSCIPKPRDVQSNCEFLKEELKEYQVTYCDVCVGNNCNSSGSLTSQLWIVCSLLFGYYVITKSGVS